MRFSSEINSSRKIDWNDDNYEEFSLGNQIDDS